LEVDVQQGNIKILQLLPKVLTLFLVEKWILLGRSETAKIGKKTEGILGNKTPNLLKAKFILQLRFYNTRVSPWAPSKLPHIHSWLNLDL
jgi:hypothetical protein